MSDNKQTLSTEVKNLVEELGKVATVNETKHQVVFENGDEIFYNNLPEGLTKEQAIALDKHKVDFALAQATVTADKGAPYMKDHKDVQKVTSTIGYKTGKFEAVFERTHVGRIPNAKEGEENTVTTHGYIRPRIVTRVPARGLLAVRAHAADLASKFKFGE